MEERHWRIVTKRARGKAAIELVEHVARHRMQIGDPPRFADGYLEALTAFVRAAVA